MLESVAVHLLARLGGVRPLLETDKREALRHTGLPVLGQEDSGDAAEPLEHIPQFLLLRHFRDLWLERYVSMLYAQRTT